MLDRSVKRIVMVLYDLLAKVASFIFPVNFVCKVDFEVPIILGKPLLATGSVFIDLQTNELKFRHKIK